MATLPPVPEDLPDTLVRQSERDQLRDIVVAEVPADRARGLGQQLDHSQIRERVDLQPPQLARSHEPIEAGGVKLLDQRLGQALLPVDLVAVAADDRLQRGRRLHDRLGIDIRGQDLVVRDLSHRVRMFRWPSGGVKRYCPSSSPTRRLTHVPSRFWRVPRPPPPHRGASDAAVPPGSRLRRAPGQARVRRVLVRRASFQRLGDDRLARDVPGRGGRTNQAHQARHRGRLPALPPSLQRGAADGAARLHDRRPRDLRLRPGRAPVGRPHARHRSDAAARPPGRGDRRHPPPDARRAPDRSSPTGSRCRTPRCSSCRCRRRCPSRSPRRSARRA